MTDIDDGERLRVIGYTRVSTEEQGDSRAGLDAQAYAINEYAASRPWDLEIVSEVASGKSMAKRPVLAAALEQLRAGDASMLVVTKLDRFSRYVPDAILTADRAVREGWNLAILDMGGDQLDTTTAAGRAHLGMMAVMAQMYRDQISENTRSALAQRKREGVVLGRPRSIPEATIARLMALRAQGMSYQAIADALNADGIRSTMGPATKDEKPRSWFKQSVALACKRYLP